MEFSQILDRTAPALQLMVPSVTVCAWGWGKHVFPESRPPSGNAGNKMMMPLSHSNGF